MTLLLISLALTTAATARATAPALTTLIAEQEVALWRCQDQLGQPRTHYSVSPYALPRSHAYRQWVLSRWTQRRTACLTALHERGRQWNWQAWLPDKWRRIGVCETQLNWQHYNSSYEGAFGFATSSWDAFKPAGYPDHASQASPWQQYQVALAIWRRYGFSGWGCRGA